MIHEGNYWFHRPIFLYQQISRSADAILDVMQYAADVLELSTSQFG